MTTTFAEAKPRKKPAATAPAKTTKRKAPAAQAAPEPTPPPEPTPEPTPPAEPEPTPEPAKQAPPAEAEAPAPVDTGLPAFDLAVGLGVLRRDLSYSGIPEGSPLTSYTLPAAPTPFLSASWYPGAHSAGSIGGNIGLAASLEYPFGFKSGFRNSSIQYSSSAFELLLGPRFRIALDKAELGAGLDYGMHSFVIEQPDPTATVAGVPKTEYKFVRPSVSIRYPLTDSLALMGSLGFRLVLSTGQIISTDYFVPERTSVWGFDFGLGAALALSQALEVRVLGNLRRYGYTMTDMKAEYDRYPATGASDMYLTGAAMIAFRK